jgi:hypothetical protein
MERRTFIVAASVGAAASLVPLSLDTPTPYYELTDSAGNLLRLPQSHEEMRQLCRHFYKTNLLAAEYVDDHVTAALSAFESNEGPIAAENPYMAPAFFSYFLYGEVWHYVSDGRHEFSSDKPGPWVTCETEPQVLQLKKSPYDTTGMSILQPYLQDLTYAEVLRKRQQSEVSRHQILLQTPRGNLVEEVIRARGLYTAAKFRRYLDTGLLDGSLLTSSGLFVYPV